MSDYDLYYWSVPFRGQFVRAVLAYAGKAWTEGGDAAISQLMKTPVKHMPVPFMGPPMLIDKKADFAWSHRRRDPARLAALDPERVAVARRLRG